MINQDNKIIWKALTCNKQQIDFQLYLQFIAHFRKMKADFVQLCTLLILVIVDNCWSHTNGFYGLSAYLLITNITLFMTS